MLLQGDTQQYTASAYTETVHHQEVLLGLNAGSSLHLGEESPSLSSAL